MIIVNHNYHTALLPSPSQQGEMAKEYHDKINGIYIQGWQASYLQLGFMKQPMPGLVLLTVTLRIKISFSSRSNDILAKTLRSPVNGSNLKWLRARE